MNSWKFWAAFAVGVAAGASVALLYAPQAGERTRRQLRRNYENAGDYLKDTVDTVSDRARTYAKRGREAVDDIVDSAQSVVGTARKAVRV
jgi:gas vesicle protein